MSGTGGLIMFFYTFRRVPFLIELFRADYRGEWNLSVTQIIALCRVWVFSLSYRKTMFAEIPADKLYYVLPLSFYLFCPIYGASSMQPAATSHAQSGGLADGAVIAGHRGLVYMFFRAMRREKRAH